MTRQQRTVFGEVATTYDEVRASYPEDVIDRVVVVTGLSDRAQILDIGCGTGKLAEPFLARGHKVLGLDPSSEMARVARRKFAGNEDFRLHLVDFQAWSPGSERFDLVVAGQSWHWMDPDSRFGGAATALRDNGHLALFWNTPQATQTPVRDALDDAYARHAPDLLAGPPGSKAGLGGRDPVEEIAGAERFELLETVEQPWERTYDVASYVKLLATQSDHRMLDDPIRSALLGAVEDAIEGAGGGEITVPYLCRAFVAKVVPRRSV